MTGNFINFFAILLGSAIGILFGSRLSQNLKSTVIAGMGLFTSAVGVQMFLKTENALVVLGALISGAILGEWWGVEDGLQNLGIWLEKRISGDSDGGSSRFVRGFLTASVLYCTGPMAVLGSISDGLRGDYLTLSIKSVLDGFLSVAFASTLGIGVAFSALPVFIYQGTISLLAAQLNAIVTTSMMNEMTATGGVLLMGIGVSSLLEIKKIRVGNFLPALAIAPVIVYGLGKIIK
jgi:uncharacterized membrane protein YqgA involved in biofilm formation